MRSADYFEKKIVSRIVFEKEFSKFDFNPFERKLFWAHDHSHEQKQFLASIGKLRFFAFEKEIVFGNQKQFFGFKIFEKLGSRPF